MICASSKHLSSFTLLKEELAPWSHSPVQGCAIKAVITNYIRLRCDTEFNQFYQNTVEKATDLTDELVFPRQSRLPAKYDDGTLTITIAVYKNIIDTSSNQVLDLLVNELSRCFDQSTFNTLEESETLLVDSCNGITVQQSSSL
uniref:Uncharacterized protein n=1 Tax=Amphimedon queenslandica TaxID=400682 RepID=A0A1X7V617_AMPQE